MALPLLCWAPPAGRRTALLIGNNKYRQVTALDNAANDATDLAALLQKFNFTVILKTDADLAGTKDALDRFTATLQPGDVALFFYAGHGMQIEGENYIIPVDFTAKNEAEAKEQAYPASKAQRSMEHSGATLNLMMLDACRNNPLRGTRDLRPNGLAIMDTALGTYIALSTGPGQLADDNPTERNGLFTKHLLASMRKPGLNLDAIFSRVKQQVADESHGRQRPWLHADVIGDFYFQNSASIQEPQGSKFAGKADPAIDGRKAYEAGDYPEAIKQFKLAVAADPENAYMYNALGAAYMRTDQASLAIVQFNQSVRNKPDYAAAYYNRGLAYLKATRYNLAEQDFTWAIDNEPNDPLTWDRRGQVRFAMLKYEDALEDFKRAVELNPADALAFQGRGQVEFRRGLYKDSLTDLNRALSLQPNLVEARIFREDVNKRLRR